MLPNSSYRELIRQRLELPNFPLAGGSPAWLQSPNFSAVTTSLTKLGTMGQSRSSLLAAYPATMMKRALWGPESLLGDMELSETYSGLKGRIGLSTRASTSLTFEGTTR